MGHPHRFARPRMDHGDRRLADADRVGTRSQEPPCCARPLVGWRLSVSLSGMACSCARLGCSLARELTSACGAIAVSSAYPLYHAPYQNPTTTRPKVPPPMPISLPSAGGPGAPLLRISG